MGFMKVRVMVWFLFWKNKNYVYQIPLQKEMSETNIPKAGKSLSTAILVFVWQFVKV